MSNLLTEPWPGVTGTLHTKLDPLQIEVNQLRQDLTRMKSRQDSMAGTMGAQAKHINQLKRRLKKNETS